MKMFWNSQQIPALKGLNFRDRMQVIRTATDSLAVPQKLALNLLKLVVLIPLFLLIARAPSVLQGLGYGVILLIVYPLVTRPITFWLIADRLRQARHKLGFSMVEDDNRPSHG
jgi:hypothetical protein